MAIYGQAGFDWMVNEVKKKESLTDIVTCAIGLIPWVCRTKKYGRIGITYGPKAVNVACVDRADEFPYLQRTVLDDLCFRWFDTGHFVKSDNFVSLSLSVDNQIIHTTRLFGLYLRYKGIWQKKEDVPYFYKDYDQLSADLLGELDADYSLIREGIRHRFREKDFKYMLDYLALERFSYNSSNASILESFQNSVTLRAIATPTVTNEKGEQVFDKHHRFFTDDIYYGLCIAKWFAQQMDLSVPTIDRILRWAQDLLEVRILDNDNRLDVDSLTKDRFLTGIPVVYGFSSLEECIS
ncbi:MAG TPA: NAD/NADP octopine/nopaline dehydrogenase family protein [bacterium]|nr:NAD/NADP octopine/nopaline dehydrogenase family protein [bacterium]